jgi:peptidoglycan/xylan/chitin deacetylase (PgdA/CDA1 family)
MDNHFKKIKVSFSVIILLLIAGIAGGSFIIKNNVFFTRKQLSQTINYLDYKLSFTQTNSDNNNSVLKNNNIKSIPVLLYHGIINEPDGANILLNNFKEQMFFLKNQGWQTVTLKDYYAFMKGEKELPDKSFLLTFDDGRKDSYYPADPILKAIDYNAVIFLITDSFYIKGSNYYLSPKEINQMIDSGRWEAQPHTSGGHGFVEIDEKGGKGHFYSNKIWLKDFNRLETDQEYEDRIKNDFIKAKDEIAKNFGVNVIGFAFPFGDFGQESINYEGSKNVLSDQAKQIYPLAFYQIWIGSDYTFNYPENDNFLAKRINVKPGWTADDLLAVLEKGQNKNLSYADNFNSDKGWFRNWGKMEINNNELILSTASTTGASVFLDGTYLWKNYNFNAKVNFTKGKTFSFIALYHDSDNYISCNYNEDGIIIREKVDGKEDRVVGWNTKSMNFKGKDIDVGISTFGNNAKCFIGDQLIVNTDFIDARLTNGGIGFKVWDPEINNSELIIKEVSVEEIK